MAKKKSIRDKYPNDPFAKEWESIGKGGSAQMFKAYNCASLSPVAIKAFYKRVPNEKTKQMEENPNASVDYFNEICAYEHAKEHIGLPLFLDAYEENEAFYVVFEYFREGSLNNIFTKKSDYTQVDVREVIVQIGSALKHCLEHGIVHRDVKLENILVRKWSPLEVALTDFNYAKDLGKRANKTIMQTCLGTLGYMAPEIYETQGVNQAYREHTEGPLKKVYGYGKPHSNNTMSYNYKVDIWSLGCVGFKLLSGGYQPFRLREEDVAYLNKKIKKNASDESLASIVEKRTVEHVMSDELQFTPHDAWTTDRVSQKAKDLLRNMLKKNYSQRFNYDQVLKHPWIVEDLGKDNLPLYDASSFIPEKFKIGNYQQGYSLI